MYRGVVRVFEELPKPVEPKGDTFPPSSPIERELTRAIEQLREIDENLGSYRREKSTQTDPSSDGFNEWNLTNPPTGYAVPKLFVRSLAEAIEQGVITYCQLLCLPEERRAAIQFLLREVSIFMSTARHLYFEVFEVNPVWYDYVKITVFDCITANQLGCADLVPPTVRTIIHNVNIPLFESAIVTEDSVPHMPQVEVSLIKFSPTEQPENRNRLIGQSVTVPLDLFVKASSIIIILENGDEREISYRAALVRKEFVEDVEINNTQIQVG
jgi:hypothetical protein